ncbi:MAG: hypothetical protein WBN34_03750 [Woeseia sp.]
MTRSTLCILLVALSGMSIGLAGCAGKPLPEGSPAIIINPDAESRAELKGILQTALHGAPLILADDALTTSSVLTIEHRAPRGLDAPAANGRLPGRGEDFLLLLDGSQCVLKQQSSGLRWLMLDTECAVAPAPD